MDSKREQATGLSGEGRSEWGPVSYRTERKFSGEEPETLDPEMLEPPVPPGGLCPLVPHGHLQPTPLSSEHGLASATHSLLSLLESL